jgi:5'-nucleotidase
VLLTNDDGIHADGLRVMREALLEVPGVELAVIAPDSNRSATARSITTRQPLWVEEVDFGDGGSGFATDGTPVDCVRFAALGLIEFEPDVIVSGINHGANLGDDVTYSGTVAGAMEGALLGIPSIGVSLERSRESYDFGPSAAASAAVAELVLQRGLAARTFLNINVPSGNPLGTRVTVQAKRNHVTVVDARIDPRNQPYYWIEEGQNEWEPHDRSDYQAVKDGYVSITPLQPDLTAYDLLDALEELGLTSLSR